MLPWFENNRFPLFLAPMAGFTDTVFRQLCKQQGADVMVTEFVLADALVRGDERVWRAVRFSPAERPMGVQIFGAEPRVMACAARMIEERLGPDFIDLNFGCPSDKVTCRHAGSSLLRDLGLLRRVASAVRRSVSSTPVTAKIRIGWDDGSIVAPEAGRILEAEGMQVLTIHGRTREQGYRGDANWRVIGETAAALTIPVVGNGNICSVNDVVGMRARWPVAGMMIGRAALGYPWIFREIKDALTSDHRPPPPSRRERWETIVHYAQKLQDQPNHRRDPASIGWMRARLKSLTKEMRGGRRIRAAIERVTTMEELEGLGAVEFGSG